METTTATTATAMNKNYSEKYMPKTCDELFAEDTFCEDISEYLADAAINLAHVDLLDDNYCTTIQDAIRVLNVLRKDTSKDVATQLLELADDDEIVQMLTDVIINLAIVPFRESVYWECILTAEYILSKVRADILSRRMQE